MLDEEDMDRLWNVCGGYELDKRFNDVDGNGGEIDFGNPKLWLWFMIGDTHEIHSKYPFSMKNKVCLICLSK